MMTKQCPKCKKVKIGELQSICRNCGHKDGNDRWFSDEDELTPITSLTGF